MIVRAIKTRTVLPKACTIFELLDESIDGITAQSILAITSKVVSLCEGRIVPVDQADKDELISQEAQLFLPRNLNPLNITLSVVRNQLVASAGIDESNSAGCFVLWPTDPQSTADSVRQYLGERFGVKEIGVLITDSTTRPLQWGTTGISIACSGFKPLRSYIGKKDLFGRPFEHHINNIQNGLAASAVVTMGEGSERTPLAVLSELDFVEFTECSPTKQELKAPLMGIKSDMYGPMFKNVPWRKGTAGK